MPEGTRWSESRGELLVWLTLPSGVMGPELRRAALALVYPPGESCYFAQGGENQLALSFANQSHEAIEEGVSLLGEIVRALHGKSTRRIRDDPKGDDR